MLNNINNTILSNFYNLGVAKFIEIAIPIITIPLLIQRLGIELYGEYIYAFSVFAIFSILVKLGLDDYGVKQLTQENKINHKSIVYSYYLVKLVFSILIICTTFTLTSLNNLPHLFFLCSLVLLGDALDSVWYFLSRNSLKVFTVAKLFSKTLYLALLVLLVKDGSDIYLVPIFYAFTYIVSGAIQIVYIKKMLVGIFNFRKAHSNILLIFKNGSHIVGSNFINTIKDRGGFIALGALGQNTLVAVFDIVFKIIMVVNIAPQIISTSYFPKISKLKSRKLFHQSMRVCMFYAAITLPILLISMYVANIFFQSVYETNYLIPIGIFTCCLLYNLSVNVAKNIIIVFGKMEILSKSALFSAMIYLLGMYLLHNQNFGIHQALFLLVTAYFSELLFRMYYILKDKLYFKLGNND